MIGLSLILLIPGLGKTPLWIYDEVRNAQCAREMFERNDWIVPTFNGELRTLKPPLHYYFMFGGFKLFGINEWGARFFSAIFGIFTILVTFFFVKKYSTPRHAFITGLVLLTSTHFLFQFRMSVPDPYLIFFNTLSIFSALAFFRENKLYWLLISAVSFGLGILAKGPVAIALPGASLLAWLIWERRVGQLLSWKILVAGILMLLVAFPWYWLVHRETNGAWTRGFFLEHNVGRFSEPMEGHGGLFLIVPLFVLVGLLPASVLIGESVKNFKSRFSNSLLRLSFCVMTLFIIFYSISGTKLPNYPMPCYPFVAILLGYVIYRAWNEPEKLKKYPFFVLLVINIVLPVAAYFGIKNEINTNGLENYASGLFILMLASLLSTYLVIRGHVRHAFMTILILYAVFNFIFLQVLYPVIYKQNPMSLSIDKVKTHQKVVAYKIFHPSYTYYLTERVPVFQNLDSLNLFLGQNEAAVISRSDFSEDLKKINLTEVAQIHDLFESSTTIVYSNKKD